MDKTWRDDANDYMNDAEYQQWQAKKAAYLKSQQDPYIQKLAESYKSDIPGGNISFNKTQPLDLSTMPTSPTKLQNVQQSVRDVTGYSDEDQDAKVQALKKLLGQ